MSLVKLFIDFDTSAELFTISAEDVFPIAVGEHISWNNKLYLVRVIHHDISSTKDKYKLQGYTIIHLQHRTKYGKKQSTANH